MPRPLTLPPQTAALAVHLAQRATAARNAGLRSGDVRVKIEPADLIDSLLRAECSLVGVDPDNLPRAPLPPDLAACVGLVAQLEAGGLSFDKIAAGVGVAPDWLRRTLRLPRKWTEPKMRALEQQLAALVPQPTPPAPPAREEGASP